MKPIRTGKQKLRLSWETLRGLDRSLDDQALARVAGGDGTYVCTGDNVASGTGASLSGSVKCR